MDRYENFGMKEVGKLDETHDRFVLLMNEMKKNGIHRTEIFALHICNSFYLDYVSLSRI